MPVTANQVAALKAYLTGDFDSHKRLFGQLDRTAAQTGYTALLTAAFFEAVDRRFAPDGKTADVVEFVADVRTRHLTDADEIDPRAAERLILAIFTDEEVDDIDTETKVSTQIILLYALIVDARLDDAQLDGFLVEASKLADEWTS
ncbi:hypothetical protein [Actinomadura sp. DC4]|uniref:hypothetical protein n=1 Tax=Actinomadura sp. DC4 TaxID=3055069 RepID=UPI0025B19835|nr:hypothetical protein [Actinomadura sp. DC4]MDN3355114.1 hypothetical protein [Actinomadura sp. DC4]